MMKITPDPQNSDEAQLLPGEQDVGTLRKQGRKKVPLPPGHSTFDWVKLVNSGKDLSGVGKEKFVSVPMSEVRKHNKEDDAWMVYQGKVYNITPYIDFHPGGKEELMRAAGKDATKLFMFKHPWVNMESMLKTAYIGVVSFQE
eukprot:TRINITY_DN4443_c0_g1_i1.p1 TRINITY_DN4443_c0_g1~~TRINITY_DN4443_c0_g1_i1.p1  ORF type:complete len:143 (-),score=31.85 TRINITY_DN4443_c0_g1_i1:101-529(-)